MIAYITVCIACLMVGNWVHHMEIVRLRRELKQIRQRLDGQE
ncbi:hypothetical protein WYO_0166 [Methylobacterium sp. GXF4]|nr:hypothetical protein WYO_0166 [Methylobacterium sp. GXF4]